MNDPALQEWAFREWSRRHEGRRPSPGPQPTPPDDRLVRWVFWTAALAGVLRLVWGLVP